MDYTDFTVLRDFAVKDRVNPCNPCLLYDFYFSVNRADFTSYNRQIKKFPTEKQNVSLKHILT